MPINRRDFSNYIKVIIFGTTGMLGRYCYNYYSEYFAVRFINRDILDAATCSEEDIMNALKPHVDKYYKIVVINCMGIIKQRESHDVMMRVNGDFPHMLNRCCKTMKLGFIHISTDCVFKGDRGDYTENDIPDATDVYGMSKAKGEGDFVVVRTSIIGSERFNKLSLLEWAKSKRGCEIPGYTNHIWNGVTCLQFCEELFYLILVAYEISQGDISRFHIHSKEAVSKYTLLEFINNTYNLELTIKPVVVPNSINRTLKSVYIPRPPDDKSILQQIQKQYQWDNANKTLFLISSLVNTMSGVFTPDQRYSQLLESIASVKKYIPDAFVVVAEGGELTESQTSELKSSCDIFLQLPISLRENLYEKSLGEATILHYAMKHVIDNNISFSHLYKLSGRYMLTDKFSDFGKKTKTIFREFKNDYTQWYSTVLYSIGWNHRQRYLEVLANSIIKLKSRMYPYIDIEHCMRNSFVPNIAELIEQLGVCGEVSYGGELVYH